jgi:hypothetical protein
MVNVVFIAYSACRSFSNFKNWIKSSTIESDYIPVWAIKALWNLKESWKLKTKGAE